MLLHRPSLYAGFDCEVSADNAALPVINRQRVHLEPRTFLLPDDADGILRWRREWAFGADTDETIVFDNLPLLHVDGASVRNCNGLPCTFSGIYLIQFRLEALDTSLASVGQMVATGVDFRGTFTLPLDRGEIAIGDLLTVRPVDGDSTLSLAFTNMSNLRLSVLIVGVETEANEEEYS